MTTSKRLADKFGATPGKLALVGVLAVVLLGVVYWNFLRDVPEEEKVAAAPRDEKASASPSPAGRRGSVTAQPAAQEPQSAKELRRRTAWPEFDLAVVAAFDPFAPSDQFPQSQSAVAAADAAAGDAEIAPVPPDAQAAEQATLAAIREQGVDLVLRNGREYVARIGDKEVRVGDKIGGFRVVEIDLRGVTLEGDSSP